MVLDRLVVLFVLLLMPDAMQSQAWQNPVLPGDHPDPSVIRVGNVYWMTSTSSEWSPQFPLFRSKDLKHWEAAGAVFPTQPDWAVGSFWAPEIAEDRGRFLVYYVGRKRGGPLCVAVATAEKPQGPYTDHGPMVCEEDGSIDPAFIRDEKGDPYLVWKEDGNSRGRATIIWAQQLAPDLIHLVGEKHQLLVNDSSWEGQVVEGPYVLKRQGRFYLFYAGNACCGTACNYAEGVARADHLLGPWEKDPANPIIRNNEYWKCPGHGAVVAAQDGKDYLLYHSYPKEGTIYLGREPVVDQIIWDQQGWPTVNGGNGPSGTAKEVAISIRENFQPGALSRGWQWPVNHQPSVKVVNGKLSLRAGEDIDDSLITRPLPSALYSVSVTVVGRNSQEAARGSLVIWASKTASVGLEAAQDHLELWQRDKEGKHILWRSDPMTLSKVSLQAVTLSPQKIAFRYRTSKQSQWKGAGEALDVTKLPIWDRGLRVGLLAEGPAQSLAVFRAFRLQGL